MPIYEPVAADYDQPWKEALTIYFESFLGLFFPEIHDSIDWSQPYRCLDKELEELVRDSEIGTRFPDKLFEVKLLNGQTQWILIHVEVQSQYDVEFTERIYRYNYRAFDKYNKPVVSVAILGDDRPNWRPSAYSYSLDGYRLLLEFPTVKLLDYQNQWESLEASDNPFAMMVMAHLKTQATSANMEERQQWKRLLFRLLLSKGYSREQVVNLFRFVDRMMSLPQELEEQLTTEIIETREERQMPFMSQFEEIAQEKGIEQGLERGTLRTQRENTLAILEVRFGEVPPEVVEAVNGIEDIPTLKQLLRQAIAIASVAQFQQLLNEVSEG